MHDRTVVLVIGREVGMRRRSCELARLLTPSMVVLEDVDLIAEERTEQSPGQTTLLFELLNEMDGLPGDADVVVLLTSNRPELLEPALVSRPGRSTWRWRSPCPTRPPGGGCSSCTGAAWSCGWTAWTGWSRGPRA
jgi:cell division protease FtsH